MSPLGCDNKEFDCDDGTCIHESLKCDGTVNCKYRYDEALEPGPCASKWTVIFCLTVKIYFLLSRPDFKTQKPITIIKLTNILTINHVAFVLLNMFEMTISK